MAEHAALVVHHDSQLCKRARLVMAGSPRLQSCRKATAGSIRSARWEGNWHASGAARISAADVVANVTGSYGEAPTSCDPRVRITARDIVSPAINPITTCRMASRKFSRRIYCAVSPCASHSSLLLLFKLYYGTKAS